MSHNSSAATTLRQLPEEVLCRARELPVKPSDVTLVGSHVYLEPLDSGRDGRPLYERSNGNPIERTPQVLPYDPEALIWRYMSVGPFQSLDSFVEYLDAWSTAPDTLAFTVFDAHSRRPIGSASFMSNVPRFLRIEIGGIWYSPVAQGTAANTETTYLMLRHAFDLGYRRVEWKCDALNTRSRRAAERIGFTFEGIQQAHMIIKGRNRDTAWFRILDHEWPAVKQALERRLYGKERDD